MPGPIRFERFNRRLQLQQYVEQERGGSGASLGEWLIVATVWGSIEGITGEEYFQADQMKAAASHRVRMRYRAGVTSRHRIVDDADGREFNVVSVIDPDGSKTYLELVVKEVV